MTLLQRQIQGIRDNMLNAATALKSASFKHTSDGLRVVHALEHTVALADDLEEYLIPANDDDLVLVLMGGPNVTRQQVKETMIDALKDVPEPMPAADPCDTCGERDTCAVPKMEQEDDDFEDEDDTFID
jgi:hypothetical protein